jgi:tellurite resistance protein TerC
MALAAIRLPELNHVPSNEILLFIVFNLFILLMLALDLGVFHRKAHTVTIKEAAVWSVVWIVLALLFNAGVFIVAGHTTGLEFFAGYLIERALSFDNIFVFLIVLSYFGVPANLQHRVLFWGIMGALITRSLFIAAGAALISRFEWVLYFFGAILVYSGIKMMLEKGTEVHPERNVFIRYARKLLPLTSSYETGTFTVRKGGKLFFTPLIVVLLAVETTDVIFAVDSIPAVFGVTRDPFIAYSSNIFAILGLRATYFLLAGVMDTFYYLSHGLSLVLLFIGVKMLLGEFLHIPIGISLAVVAGILVIAVVASLLRNRLLNRQRDQPPNQGA